MARQLQSSKSGMDCGCTLAPTPLLQHDGLMLDDWCHSLGVDILYKFGGRLIGIRTRGPLKEVVISSSSLLMCS